MVLRDTNSPRQSVPADGTGAANSPRRPRHIPLAALRGNYTIGRYGRKGLGRHEFCTLITSRISNVFRLVCGSVEPREEDCVAGSLKRFSPRPPWSWAAGFESAIAG